ALEDVPLGVRAVGGRGRGLVRVAVGEVGLRRWNRRADVCRGRGPVRAVPEAEVGRNRDRQQDADDHDDNEELDQREAFLTLEPLPQLGHAILLQVVGLAPTYRVPAAVFRPLFGGYSPL